MMVDSRNFKKSGNSYNKRYKNAQNVGKGRKNPLVPLIVVILMAVILLLLQYFMLDVLQNAYQQMEIETTTMSE